ncbi:DUF547 domain-containing protein [Pseudozobellia sp. WGM2]|uniref:DUF547 domain-containing protein n=1 Tax=Pseudozobellia sp. WGM2 TaxID=2787625 RepID=UPI001AE01B6F|nr:DUF547 domain-containing protein [Pseudozobellia sp. WGM2]
MKNLILLFTCIFALGNGYSQSVNAYLDKAESFFSTYVKDGKVDYKEIKNDSSELDELLTLAADIRVDKENANEFQAFWINGYNILVIKSIVENYPLKSPVDVKGFFDVKKHKFGGENVTLDEVENKLLRGNFPDEPRFHFVLVCAGLGCPPIINEAYRPTKLDEQLERQTKLAINDPMFIRVNKNKVKVSQIFEWYNDDFTSGQTLVDFINEFRSEELPENTKVSYYPYDWTLNEVK